MFVQPFGLGVDGGGAETAGDEDVVLTGQLFRGHGHEIGGIAQRADHVRVGVTYGEAFHHIVAGGTDELDNYRDCATHRVGIADGERDALALFLVPDYEKLPGKGSFRDAGSLHHYFRNGGAEHRFF